MNYKILSATVQGSDITTLVKYDFLDIPIDVYHSRPKTLDDISTGIINRALSEQTKITDASDSASLVEIIPTGTIVEI